MTILVKNAAAVNFPKCTGGTENATRFGIHTAASGGTLLFLQALASDLAISNNVRPQFAADVLTVTPGGSIQSQWAIDSLKLVFQNAAAAGIGDASGLQPSATAGNLYVSLYTAAAECAYTSYARVAVARSSGGWTVVEA